MTDLSMPTAKQPLGVGALLGESFSLYFRNFVPLSVMTLVPVLISYAASFGMVGFPASPEDLIAQADPFFYYRENGLMVVLSTLIGMAAWGFCMAGVTRLAYDAKLGNPVSIVQGLRAGLSNLVMVGICLLLASIGWVFGFILLIVPGLIIWAAWLLIVPAIVVEKAGFGCFGRSRSLTKGYRWPLIGLLILFALVLVIMSVIVGVITAAVTFGTYDGSNLGESFATTMLVTTVLNTIMTVIMYGLSGTLGALSYARLVEIKEGTSVQSLADVFS